MHGEDLDAQHRLYAETDLYDDIEEHPVNWDKAMGCVALLLLSGAVVGLFLILIYHLLRRFT